MIEWVKRLFGQPGSSVTAKERLRLVLMTDHLELAPDIIESMKRDLVDVISRYVEVDRERIEVNFEQQDRALAMLANIPILSVNRPSNGTKVPAEAAPVEAAPVAAAPNVASPGAQGATENIVVRRRRRKRKNQAIAPGTNPAPAH
ncbi:MAG TPA: cell division topological specificity factor MinE [Candidatus Baltobacteraceae bacterium]|jgi:cell division topological specificity factor|nr:cell division topological specificity factor MinE [Candidatus Baltobacteraceae bacterium]